MGVVVIGRISLVLSKRQLEATLPSLHPITIVRQTYDATDTTGIDKHEAIVLVINMTGAAS